MQDLVVTDADRYQKPPSSMQMLDLVLLPLAERRPRDIPAVKAATDDSTEKSEAEPFTSAPSSATTKTRTASPLTTAPVAEGFPPPTKKLHERREMASKITSFSPFSHALLSLPRPNKKSKGGTRPDAKSVDSPLIRAAPKPSKSLMASTKRSTNKQPAVARPNSALREALDSFLTDPPAEPSSLAVLKPITISPSKGSKFKNDKYFKVADDPFSLMPMPVLDGYDRLHDSLRKLVGKLGDGDLNEKWNTISNYIDAYSAHEDSYTWGEWCEEMLGDVINDDNDVPSDKDLSACCLALDGMLRWLILFQPRMSKAVERLQSTLYRGIFKVASTKVWRKEKDGKPEMVPLEYLPHVSGSYISLTQLYESLLHTMTAEEQTTMERVDAVSESMNYWKNAYTRMMFTSWKHVTQDEKKFEAQCKKYEDEVSVQVSMLERSNRRLKAELEDLMGRMEDVNSGKQAVQDELKAVLKASRESVEKLKEEMRALNVDLDQKNALIMQQTSDLAALALADPKTPTTKTCALPAVLTMDLFASPHLEDDLKVQRIRLQEAMERDPKEISINLGPGLDIPLFGKNDDPLVNFVNFVLEQSLDGITLEPIECFFSGEGAVDLLLDFIRRLSPTTLSFDIWSASKTAAKGEKINMACMCLHSMKMPGVDKVNDLLNLGVGGGWSGLPFEILFTNLFALTMGDGAQCLELLEAKSSADIEKVNEKNADFLTDSGTPRTMALATSLENITKRCALEQFADITKILPSRKLGEIRTSGFAARQRIQEAQAAQAVEDDDDIPAQNHLISLLKPKFFESLGMSRCNDVAAEAQDIFFCFAGQLMDSYRYYSARDQSQGLSVNEWIALLKDGLDPKQPSSSLPRIKVLSIKSDKDVATKVFMAALKVLTAGEAGNKVMSLPEYGEALARLAFRYDASGKLWPDVVPPLTDFVDTLEKLVWNISENCNKFETNEIQILRNTRPVQDVITKYRPRLLKIFRIYAALDNTPKSKGTSSDISLVEFTALMRDMKVTTGGSFSGKLVQDLFFASQCLGPGDEGDTMVFQEFLDAILTVAMIKFPNPLSPVHQRFTQFMEDFVLPMMKRRII